MPVPPGHGERVRGVNRGLCAGRGRPVLATALELDGTGDTVERDQITMGRIQRTIQENRWEWLAARGRTGVGPHNLDIVFWTRGSRVSPGSSWVVPGHRPVDVASGVCITGLTSGGYSAGDSNPCEGENLTSGGGHHQV